MAVTIARLAWCLGHSGKTYYYVRYNTKDGNVALWRMDGPKRTVLTHGGEHEQLRKDAWHAIELVVDGRKVRASVNNKLHVETSSRQRRRVSLDYG